MTATGTQTLNWPRMTGRAEGWLITLACEAEAALSVYDQPHHARQLRETLTRIAEQARTARRLSDTDPIYTDQEN